MAEMDQPDPETPRRRHDDYDWRVSAPRWVLVSALVVMFAGMPIVVMLVSYVVRGYVQHGEDVAQEVTGLQVQLSILKARTATLERATMTMCEDIRDTRIELLTWQSWSAERSGDAIFARDLAQRVRTAQIRARGDGCSQVVRPEE